MKYVLIALMIVCATASVQAAKKPKTQNKQQYIEMMKKWAESKGKEFKQERFEARFDELDTNKDGLLTQEEKEAGKKKQ